MCWSYEEEVRVVKLLDTSEINETIWLPSGPLNLAEFPRGSVKEVYLGIRCTARDDQSLRDLSRDLKKLQPDAQLLITYTGDETWGLTARPFSYPNQNDR